MSKRIIIYGALLIILIIALVFYFTREIEHVLVYEPPMETEPEIVIDIILADYPTLDMPVFSHPPGFYSEPFYLYITAGQGIIRFTLDGSIPTPSSQIFTGSLQIRSMEESPMSAQGVGRSYEWAHGWRDEFIPGLFYNGMVVRAVAFDEYGNFSETVTSSFFVEHNGRGIFNTRVLSLVMEPEHFIHETQGMYRNWDRAMWPHQEDVHSEDGPRHIVHAQMFYPDGSLMFSQYVNAWVFGNWSRRHPKRSFRLNFNQGDGDLINMPGFIPGVHRNFYNPLEFVTNFRHLNARVSDYGSTLIRCSLVAFLSTPLRPTVQAGTYGAVFINGEFWGMYCLRVQRHAHLLSEMFGIPSGSIELRDWTEGLIYMPYIRGRNLSQPEEFYYLNNYIDMDDFIDYLILGYHFENWDWINNNFEFWRSTEYIPGVHGGDMRWRFVVQDFDNSIFHPANNMMQFFTTTAADGMTIPTLPCDFGDTQRRPNWAVRMIRSLFSNEIFRNTFVARYSTYMGTAFHPSRANAIIDQMVEERIDTIGFDFYRWGHHGVTNPASTGSWLGWGHWSWGSTISCLRYTLSNRANYSLYHILIYFNEILSLGLSTEFTNIRFLTDKNRGWFDISGAQIRADLFAQSDFNNYDFSLDDFNAEYIRGLPIIVTANPLYGYEFSHFEVDGTIFTENPMILTPQNQESIIVTAVFTGN